MRTRRSSSHRRALLPFLLAVGLSLGATTAAGLQPTPPRPVPESAFTSVTVEGPLIDATAGSRRAHEARAHAGSPIADPWLILADSPERPRPSLPIAKPTVVNQPVAAPKSSSPGTHSISGRASWYCEAGVSPCSSSYPDSGGFDAYAAAGPRLRAALGSNWRGMVVSVDGVRVKLIDWCQCYQGQSNEKLLDLYHDVFLRVGSTVTIRW